ncbi:hypothetical protein HNP72_001727 [Sphingobacterium soli]|nr:hypothetical protein [Sphingobacterium soli]
MLKMAYAILMILKGVWDVKNGVCDINDIKGRMRIKK